MIPNGSAVAVITDGCVGCGACILTCPEHAIRPVAASSPGVPGKLVVLGSHCTGCAECVEICPADAIGLEVLM